MFPGRQFGYAMCLALAAHGQTIATAQKHHEVLVPALVLSTSGDVAYGLSRTDFFLRDNGTEQRISLESDFDAKPRSLILLIQVGHTTPGQLEAVRRLPVLLDSILTNPQDQLGIIAFDSSPHTLQQLAPYSESASTVIASVPKGNSGAALYDAVHLAIGSFRKAAPGNQQILILISGDHDHGSVGSDGASLIREVASTNVLIYCLSFGSGKRELFDKLRSMTPLTMTTSAIQRNAGGTLAHLTGGEFSRFGSERQFEDRVTTFASHIHNLYNLTYTPINPQPGFHSLQVEVGTSKVNVVSSRAAYWVSDTGTPSEGGSE